MIFYISINFHENILNSFKLYNCVTDGQTDGQTTKEKQDISIPVKGGGVGGGGCEI